MNIVSSRDSSLPYLFLVAEVLAKALGELP